MWKVWRDFEVWKSPKILDSHVTSSLPLFNPFTLHVASQTCWCTCSTGSYQLRNNQWLPFCTNCTIWCLMPRTMCILSSVMSSQARGLCVSSHGAYMWWHQWCLARWSLLAALSSALSHKIDRAHSESQAQCDPCLAVYVEWTTKSERAVEVNFSFGIMFIFQDWKIITIITTYFVHFCLW